MAAAPANPRRAGRTPGRPRARISVEPDSEPPAKRRKYVPGGPGGGGHWLEADEVDRRLTSRESALDDEDELGNKELGSNDDDEAMLATPAARADSAETPRSTRPRTYSRPRRDREGRRPRGRPPGTPRPRYSSAAAAAAASQANDGYKPREERSWEEFHPDLDIEADLMVFTADEVDGKAKQEPRPSMLRQDTSANDGEELGDGNTVEVRQPQAHMPDVIVAQNTTASLITPKRRPGRPPRRPESMLSGLGSPPAPRILPLPTHNPKERLNLPKPSFRQVETFKSYEENKKTRTEDFVDKSMANVGYQESERFEIPQDILIRHSDGLPDDDMGAGLVLASDAKAEAQGPPQLGDVEYDMDEQDERWLEAHNLQRKGEQGDAVKPALFEITMTQIEREYYALEKRIPKPNPRHPNPTTRPRSSSAAAVNGETLGTGDEPDSKCAICDDGDCENANAIIFCDGCDLAVHQECYGVPFIPEGQWFCRKCKEIGRGTPTCVFCPNIDGAFKQTNTLRWSHLLCAIWIPEVTIANLTFMEPIQDVDKVPRSRWGLVCYICQQRMGACIQCGNKACYQAFHVTCARRARLFLRMKSSHAGGIDTSVLKAFCNRHVPSDWRRDHDVDNAIVDAKRYYRRTMRDRQWADSQTAALTMNVQPALSIEAPDDIGPNEDNGTIVVAGSKRKKKDAVKTGWKLASGAPVVPAVVFNAVESSLRNFVLRKKKEFIAEACKYWTLKREARRGAALLKRLQLQLESFSSMEITRRNFVGMGAAGRPRLLRRIEFAEMLTKDMDRLEHIISNVTLREHKKLEDAENLKQLIDSIYFPISDLLWPILKKAQKLGEKSIIFDAGLEEVGTRIGERHYISVVAFSADIANVFSSALAQAHSLPINGAIREISELDGDSKTEPPTAEQRAAIVAEQKNQKAVAKRIIKAIKEPLEQALQKEAQLKGTSLEPQHWVSIDTNLNDSIRNGSIAQSVTDEIPNQRKASDVSATVGASPSGTAEDIVMNDASPVKHEVSAKTKSITPRKRSAKDTQPTQAPSPPISSSSHTAPDHTNPISTTSANIIPTSFPSTSTDPWSTGGVPWYMRPFSPVGTTVHDAPTAIRESASEDLSDIDESALQDPDIVTVVSKSEATPKPKATPAAKKAKAPTNRRSSRKSKTEISEDATATVNADEASVSIDPESATPVKPSRARKEKAIKEAPAAGEDDGEEKEKDKDKDAVETEKERIAKEKRDAYNAKRRAARKSAKGLLP